ncbi:glycoside hydrolase family 6 protein [Actinomycetes bacterium KLBMP 9797]
MTKTLGAVAVLVLSLGIAPGASASPPPASPTPLSATTRFYTPPPNPAAVTHITDLARTGHIRDAALVAKMVATPQAVWFNGGTPAEARAKARETMRAAARQHAVPVLVVYNIPFRDCAQYSAGGALNTADYLAWVDAFASGIGRGRAVVLVEPDGLGIIPFYTNIGGHEEWCQPVDAAGNPQPGASPAERYAALNGAVDRLGRLPNVRTYLDATHSGWLGTPDATERLVKAGVERADGFFLNVSNYQPTPHLQKLGTWISSCLAFVKNPEDGGWRLGNYRVCASQWEPATIDDFSTWVLSDQWYADNMGSAVPTTRFVVDTSRSGQGANDMSAYGKAPYNQPESVVTSLRNGNWCNPPGRGVGPRPTANTGVPLLDAYVWAKIPGESDGSCDIAGGARAWDFGAYNPWNVPADAQSTFDPLWGRVDPPAGQWFRAQALELAKLANPPLR